MSLRGREVGRGISPDRLGELMAEKASRKTKSESSGAMHRVPKVRTRVQGPQSQDWEPEGPGL